MGLVQWLSSLVIFAMGIVVLIRLFQREGVLKGILGLICMLYTFIWGWIHRKDEHIENIMYIWTGLVVLGVILNLVASRGN